MKHIRKLLATCFLLCSVFALNHSWAADAALPSMGDKSGKAIATEALAKDALCTKCHDESQVAPVLSLYQTKHGVRGDARTPTCQSCHGESANHLKGADEATGTRPAPDHVFKKGVYKLSEDKERATQCLACHQDGQRNNWDGGQHQMSGVACNDCHIVHRPKDRMLDKRTQTEACFACHKDQRAQTHRVSTHPLDAGKMGCSDCHNPHGSNGPKLLVKNSVNETCYTCHAEKRGPFLWEHAPVTDDCTNCHTPHGSTNTPLLKVRAPFLCQECHSGDHGKTLYSGGNLPSGNVISVNGAQGVANQSPPAQLNGRACMNCHSLVHGSNHPAGAKFQR